MKRHMPVVIHGMIYDRKGWNFGVWLFQSVVENRETKAGRSMESLELLHSIPTWQKNRSHLKKKVSTP
jgi:hypothetical protein